MFVGTTFRMGFINAVFALVAVVGLSPAHAEVAGLQVVNLPASARATDLPETSAGFYAPEDITRPAEIRSVQAAFNRHLMGIGQRVRFCEQMVRIQIGKDSLVYGRGLAAYGAYCTLANGRLVAMCHEEAAGRFALVFGSFSIGRSWIESFTSGICIEE